MDIPEEVHQKAAELARGWRGEVAYEDKLGDKVGLAQLGEGGEGGSGGILLLSTTS